MSTHVEVARLPKCDICKQVGYTQPRPAEYDFRTSTGSWAYGCKEHWINHRMYRDLGTGKGQQLVVRK